MDLLKLIHPRPGRLLLMGLGGGSLAKSFYQDGWNVDAVEIDPAIIRTAHRYFGLEEHECRTFEVDGRRYLSSTDDSYDLMIFDAYGSSSIPFHLVTTEVFELAASRLASEGILAMNIESVGWEDPIVGSLARTLGATFRFVLALPTQEPPNVLGNVVLLASRRPLEFDENFLEHPQDYVDDVYRHWVVVQKNHAWDNRFAPKTENLPLLTDDLNSVDLWAENINLTARRMLHKNAPWKHLAW
jgi:spermidine synthase